jgi:hypothetical protein
MAPRIRRVAPPLMLWKGGQSRRTGLLWANSVCFKFYARCLLDGSTG